MNPPSYPSLKPLKIVKDKPPLAMVPKGMVSVRDYEHRLFQKAMKPKGKT